MKTKPTSSIITLLYLGFSIVFLAATLLLVFFIWLTPQLTKLTEESKEATGQLRATLNLRSSINELELAINRYEISGDDFYVVEYQALQTKLSDQMDRLSLTASEEELTAIDDIRSGLQELDQAFGAIRGAYESEDFEAVDELGTEVYSTIMPGITDSIEAMVAEQAETQLVFEEEMWAFQANIYMGLLVSLPLMILASVAAAWIITQKINRPLVLLAEAARDLQRGKADLKGVESLASSGGQVAELAADFLEMASNSNQEDAALASEAESIRTKIR